jgi:hypothetical protein
MPEPRPDAESVAWIERELAAVSDLHPAFDPTVWALGEAEQAQAAQIDQAIDLSERVRELEATVADLTRTVTRLLQAWLEE